MSTITIPNVILSYPHLDAPWAPTPKPGEQQQTEKYSATYIFPKDYDVAPVQAAIEAAAKEAIAAGKWKDGFQYAQPWKQVKEGIYEGCWSFTAKDAKFQPDVVDTGRNPVLDPKQIFAGCKIHASVTFYGTTTGGGPRVAAGLGPIMIVDNSDNMPRLSAGGVSVEDAFGSIPGAPAATAPVGGTQSGPAAVGAPQQATPGNPLAS